MARSAALFVGSTPSTRTKVHRAVIDLEHFPTDAFCLGHATGLARFEPPRDRAPDRTHRDPELGVCEAAIADAMPRMKHLPGLLPQALPNLLRRSAAFNHGFKVPQQMRPAHLPPPGGIPRVGTPAIRHQDAAEPLAQQLLRDLGPT